MIYGYARVSTTGQNLATQELALQGYGVNKIFSEKVSGVKQRRELEKLIAKLQPGDIVVVSKLDRLARSTLDLLTIIDTISKAGAGFKSLGDAWADTTTPHGRLMVTMLAGIAEFERSLILQRTADGRARAKAEGKHLGRHPKLTPHQEREILARLASEESVRSIARSYNVNYSTISRIGSRAAAAAMAAS